MPYVKKDDRWRFVSPTNAGELNYAITMVLSGYLVDHGLNYQHINDCMGALEGAKAEFYRRVAVPYEEDKIAANGDVYPVITGGEGV